MSAMQSDPHVHYQYKTSDKTSFASVTVEDRWPIILTAAIDDVHRTTGTLQDDTELREGKAIVEALAKLKYEIQHNRQMTPIADDGQPDVHGYNEELEQLEYPYWHDVPWLYSECYLYRRISTFFTLSSRWKSYDVFGRQKLSTFKSSQPAVVELAARYRLLVGQLTSGPAKDLSAEETTAAEQELFTEMCEICLWGNATDLSLLTNLSYEDLQKLQGSKARKAAEANIIVNDFSKAFQLLKTAQNDKSKQERRVDIVLDNAGFELFVDLVLAGYLIASGLATHIVLHPKSIPWFVSDALPKDFSELLNALADPQEFYASLASDDQNSTPLSNDEVDNIKALFDHWSSLHAEGSLIIRPNRFWTHAGTYWRMPATASSLYEDLRTSELVIFKGDLNGRKLLGDVMWDPTTPFSEVIGPLGIKGQGLRLLQMRTCKADVVAGLPQGEDERLRDTEGGGGDTGARKWTWTGKWAVVQYHDGK
ncbi:MAG: hypothetical protein M1828_004904 [Chrysothrix sp. TS-e1954]|nr:MAG: hypothetical protein M1828_004904 [Chrysothrix sp. TS-e1954]